MGRFTPEDCRVCLDKLAYAADIAVGDTWDHPTMHPGRIHFNCTEEDFQRDPILAEARHGISLIAVRSEKGETLLKQRRQNRNDQDISGGKQLLVLTSSLLYKRESGITIGRRLKHENGEVCL